MYARGKTAVVVVGGSGWSFVEGAFPVLAVDTVLRSLLMCSIRIELNRKPRRGYTLMVNLCGGVGRGA